MTGIQFKMNKIIISKKRQQVNFREKGWPPPYSRHINFNQRIMRMYEYRLKIKLKCLQYREI